ncbi:MAG TPA: hypothetical protein VJM32_01355 [Candidatus Saccharimonadales bacterium]|nr:hypothetical protein [Candidatus Saccharimonadales bacterium]
MQTALIVIGSLIAALGTLPYIIATVKGDVKPRLVTWLTWALLTGIAGAAALSANQLGSALFAFLGTLATGSVVVAGFRFGDRTFKTLDVVSLAGVVVGLALWYVLDDPAYAVLAAIAIDFVGLLPTLAHAWTAPREEAPSAFVCVGIGGAITVAAIIMSGDFSLTALGYPLYAAVSMGICAAIILVRGRIVLPPIKEEMAG